MPAKIYNQVGLEGRLGAIGLGSTTGFGAGGGGVTGLM